MIRDHIFISVHGYAQEEIKYIRVLISSPSCSWRCFKFFVPSGKGSVLFSKRILRKWIQETRNDLTVPHVLNTVFKTLQLSGYRRSQFPFLYYLYIAWPLRESLWITFQSHYIRIPMPCTLVKYVSLQVSMSLLSVNLLKLVRNIMQQISKVLMDMSLQKGGDNASPQLPLI